MVDEFKGPVEEGREDEEIGRGVDGFEYEVEGSGARGQNIGGLVSPRLRVCSRERERKLTFCFHRRKGGRRGSRLMMDFCKPITI